MEKATTAFALALLQGPGVPVDWSKRSTWKWPTELSVPPKGFGVGFDFRMPSTLGLSFSYLHERHLMSAQIAPYFNQELYSGSYLYELYSFSEQDPTIFPLYLGIGMWAREDGRLPKGTQSGLDSWGIQFPISFQAQDKRAALDVYLEYAPAIQLYPYFNVGAYFGTGLRVYHLNRVVESKAELIREWKAYNKNKKNPLRDSEDFD